MFKTDRLFLGKPDLASERAAHVTHTADHAKALAKAKTNPVGWS